MRISFGQDHGKWIQEGLDDGVGGCVASGRESVKEVVPVLVYGVRTPQKNLKFYIPLNREIS